jgi:DNA repair protein RadC
MVDGKSSTRRREDRAIARALGILERRLCQSTEPYTIDSVGAAQQYAVLRLAALEREVFLVIYLDARHRVIGQEVLFQGTLTQTAVHAREIARGAMRHNAAAVVLVHNHPSGHLTFSKADEAMTESIRVALALVDVSVLDHLLVAGASVESIRVCEERREAERRSEWERTDRERRAHQSAAMKAAWARRRARAERSIETLPDVTAE